MNIEKVSLNLLFLDYNSIKFISSFRAVESWDKRAALPAELESQLLCEKMLQNFQDFEKLRSLYPDTYKEIR